MKRTLKEKKTGIKKYFADNQLNIFSDILKLENIDINVDEIKELITNFKKDVIPKVNNIKLSHFLNLVGIYEAYQKYFVNETKYDLEMLENTMNFYKEKNKIVETISENIDNIDDILTAGVNLLNKVDDKIIILFINLLLLKSGLGFLWVKDIGKYNELKTDNEKLIEFLKTNLYLELQEIVETKEKFSFKKLWSKIKKK